MLGICRRRLDSTGEWPCHDACGILLSFANYVLSLSSCIVMIQTQLKSVSGPTEESYVTDISFFYHDLVLSKSDCCCFAFMIQISLMNPSICTF